MDGPDASIVHDIHRKATPNPQHFLWLGWLSRKYRLLEVLMISKNSGDKGFGVFIHLSLSIELVEEFMYMQQSQ